MFSIEKPNPDNINELANNLRADDMAEVDALTMRSVEIALQDSVNNSEESYIVRGPEGVLAMLGIARFSLLDDKMSPWFITGNGIEKHPKELLRGTKVAVNYWKHKYGKLEAYIDAKYEKSLRWARWAGFTIHPPAPFGPFGNPFCKVTIEREN